MFDLLNCLIEMFFTCFTFCITNPSQYSYLNDPNLSRGICLNKASSCLVLLTLTCALPKPLSLHIIYNKKFSAGNCVRLRIPVQESEDSLAHLKNHWCIYILLCIYVYCLLLHLGVGETGTFLGDPFRFRLPKDFSMPLCLCVQKTAKLMKSSKLPGDFWVFSNPTPS